MRTFFFTILLLILGGLSTLEGINHARENSAFRARGEASEILSVENLKRQDQYKRKRGSLETQYVSSSYSGEVVFETKQGEMITVPPKSLPRGVADAVKAGQSVPIWYVSDQPTMIRFQDKEAHAMEEIIFGSFLLLCGGYFARRMLRSDG